MELWYQQHSYLTSPQAVQAVEATIDQAAAAGYTGMVLWDSSINVVNQPFWSSNLTYLQQVIAYAHSKGMKVMPQVFPYGYSNDILNQNPNWAEGQRVTGTQFQVSADGTTLNLMNSFPGLQNASFESGQTAWFSYGDADVAVDTTVAHTGSSSARIAQGPGSSNARLFQQFTVKPWRQYHLRFWLKTQNLYFSNGFNTYIMDSSDWNAQRLNAYISLSGVLNVNQDWTEYDYTINSESSTSLSLLMGEWGGSVGTVWIDDVQLEETDLIYVIRRAGTPLTMYDPANPSTVFQEGVDYNPISDPEVAPGGFTDYYHTPPVVTLPSGTHLKPNQIVAIDSYAVQPVNYAQVGMCLTDPDLQQYLQANIKSVVNLFGTGNPVMFGYDEMRHLNSCATCKAKNMSAGQLLAWNVGQSMSLLNNASPNSPVYVWGDMFDPNMNAHNDYYFAEGDVTGSWLGLPSNATIMNWNLWNLTTSLKFFAGMTPQQTTQFRQVIAGFYDQADNDGWSAGHWEVEQALGIPGLAGVMYTTWVDNYGQLANFAAGAKQAWPDYLASIGLNPNGTITGIVHDSANNPVAGAQISAALAGGTPVTGTTGADGSFTLSNLSPGTYSITASATGYTATAASASVTAGASTTVSLTLTAMAPSVGTISGTVTGAGGVAISAATVSYSGGSTTTAANGSYALSNVPPGTVNLTASAPNFSAMSQTATVASGATTTVNFVLAALTGNLSGIVASTAGKSIAGATVTISGGAVPTTVTTTTDSKGNFAASAMPVGNYQVTVVKGSYTTQTKASTLSANTTTTLNFAMVK